MKVGQRVKVSFTGNNEQYEGRVYYIQKIPSNEEINVKIKLDYSDKLKFGTNAKVEILTDEAIDESVKEYDIKNNAVKIGKTKLILKNSGGEAVESFDMNALLEEYMNQMMSEMNMGEGTEMGDMPFEFEDENGESIDELSEELSEQWSEYWNEYWNQYWKAYYEEYQTIIEVPAGTLDETDTSIEE